MCSAHEAMHTTLEGGDVGNVIDIIKHNGHRRQFSLALYPTIHICGFYSYALRLITRR